MATDSRQRNRKQEGVTNNFTFLGNTARYQPQSALAQYVEDVRKRKRTIAKGDGEVHGARYATRDWGISELAF